MKSLIVIREIRAIYYLTSKYIILNFYISETTNRKIKIIKIVIEVYLIKSLKVKLLIKVNILNSKEIDLNFYNKTLSIKDKDR